MVSNVASFCFLKEQVESAGEIYKYSDITEDEMWKIADSKFEAATKTIKYIKDGLKSEEWSA